MGLLNKNKIMTKQNVSLAAKLSLAFGLGFFALMVFMLQIYHTPDASADSLDNNYIGRMSTSTAFTVAGTSVQILATSTARSYAIISNDSSVPVYLSLNNGIAATAHSGIFLAASSTYTINNVNDYIGGISAITTGSSVQVLVTAAQ